MAEACRFACRIGRSTIPDIECEFQYIAKTIGLQPKAAKAAVLLEAIQTMKEWKADSTKAKDGWLTGLTTQHMDMKIYNEVAESMGGHLLPRQVQDAVEGIFGLAVKHLKEHPYGEFNIPGMVKLKLKLSRAYIKNKYFHGKERCVYCPKKQHLRYLKPPDQYTVQAKPMKKFKDIFK